MTLAWGGAVILNAGLVASGQTASSQWPIYGLGVAALLYILLRPMMRKKKDPLDRDGPGLGLAQQRAVEREMSNLLVELSEMSREVSAHLDTRAAKLEVLIQEADQRIAELKRLGQGAGPAATGVSAAQPQPGEGPMDQRRREPAADERYRDVYDLADQGHSPQEIAHRLERPCGEVELILSLRR